MICTLLFPPLMMFNLTLGKEELIATKECVKHNRVSVIDVSTIRGVMVDLVYDEHLVKMNVKDSEWEK